MSLRTCKLVVLLFIMASLAWSKCAFSQSEAMMPFAYNGEPFPINYTMQACKQYIGDDVCCNEPNAILTAANLVQVDGAFASASGGCDICAINLKRFWCEYTCSPRQSDFVKVSKQYKVYPDPMRPGKYIEAQEVNLTVQASTACAIYNSCRRTPFVTAVSAMGSTAGFLNFQGHNAIDNAHQYINVFFTLDKEKGLYFGNDTGKNKTGDITACNYRGGYLHGFEVKQTCSCNTCEQACDSSKGFQYTQPNALQGFNWVLVISTYAFVAVAAGSLTYYRTWRKKQKQE